MPSTLLMNQSGGAMLVSGGIFSGQIDTPRAGVMLKLSRSGIGPVFVSVPNLSGALPTLNSGGNLTSGGLADGVEISPGDNLFIPKNRLVSGIESIRVQTPAASSGARLFWEWDVMMG